MDKIEEERLRALADFHGLARVADEFIEKNLSFTEALEQIVLIKKAGGTKTMLDLTERDLANYSLLKLVSAQARGNATLAPFEMEISSEISKKVGRNPRGVFVPEEVFMRDLTVGTDTAGGYLKPTETKSIVGLLRDRLVLQRAGATVVDGLVGDVAIPKLTGAAAAYWVAESESPTESQQTFGQVTMSPKTVGAYTDISRKLLIQSSAQADQLVRNDLTQTILRAIQLAAFHGTGADNQPTGLANTTGVATVEIGTNGGPPTWEHIVDLETEVGQESADVGALGYITNSRVRGKLRQTFVNATYGDKVLWQPGKASDVGEVNGYPAYVTNQVASDLDKGTSTGVCSAIFFGNWKDLVIGLWSGLDILVDPYTGGTAGTLRLVAMQDCDVAVRHPESFAMILDATTT